MAGHNMKMPAHDGGATATMTDEIAGQMKGDAHAGMKHSEHAGMTHGATTDDAMAGGDHATMMQHGSMAGMSSDDHGQAMYRDSLWASFVNLLLGVWLVTSPPTLGYGGNLALSDYASGTLIIFLSLLTFVPRLNTYARWAVCFVGIWLLFAPLVFWTPSAAAYLNDSLVGALVIAFAVLVTMMPGMDMSVMMTGPDIPPGWSYNPSTWLQRAPIILLAAIGFFASRYMAAYQLGHIPDVYDPFFGDGTRRVLQSDVSKMFPISDAGLGALSYVIEMLMGFMGDRARWRTMPWMVMFFGILVVPLGVTSIVLIMMQPIAVGAWCSLCLLAGLAMLVMVPATLDEVVAMLQFMKQSRDEGKPLWRTFWMGGVIEGGEQDTRLTPFDWSRPQEMFAGWLKSNWHLLVAAGLGVWLLFAPSVFGTLGSAANSDYLIGALIITFALIAIAEVSRAARFLNLLFGAWLFVAPWVLGGFVTGARWNNMVVGALLFLLSLPRGRIRGEYGSWQPYIV
ncbi:MAG: SPW repeat protein [Acidobacteriota bacterium]|nr:SPW repeat protein [Acidobacteriota bacterium]